MTSPADEAPWPISRSPSIEAEIQAELERLDEGGAEIEAGLERLEAGEAEIEAGLERLEEGGAEPGEARPTGRARTALIACGALAREVLALRERHGWDADVLGVPALLHNRPERLPSAVQARIRQARAAYERVLVVYGDCGTGGMLDRLLEAEGVERIPGPHCFEFYADQAFHTLMAEAPGTFFLTDYMVRSFDHLVIQGLGLDRFPELRSEYFRNYTRVVYLAQAEDPELRWRAGAAAERLGLPLTTLQVGMGALERRLVEWFAR